MKKTTQKRFELTPADTREALAGWLNKIEPEVDEKRMVISFDFGTLDNRKQFPTITIIDGDFVPSNGKDHTRNEGSEE